MAAKSTDVVILTDRRYLTPLPENEYKKNVFLEDRLLQEALEKQGLRVLRTNWDDANFDWTTCHYAIFRSTWDYFDRFKEFSDWLERTTPKCAFINTAATIRWNMDKHYLLDLEKQGTRIPPSIFVEPGDERTLEEIATASGWDRFILKPAVSGDSRHTHLFNADGIDALEQIFKLLIKSESMMLQQYQESIVVRGEISIVLLGGKYSHCVLKQAKLGDFKVQEDFGGTLHEYPVSDDEIALAENVMAKCGHEADYARVDIMWDSLGRPCITELELIEPELWFRRKPTAAPMLAKHIKAKYFA